MKRAGIMAGDPTHRKGVDSPVIRRRSVRGAFAVLLLGMTAVLAPGQEKSAGPFDRNNAAIEKTLEAKTDIEVLNVPLEEFLKTAAKDHGLAIRLDRSGFKRAGVAPSIRITASFKQVPLGLALRQILRPLKLQHRIADGAVLIEDLRLPLDAAHPPGSGPVGPQRTEELIHRLVGPIRPDLERRRALGAAVRIAPAIRAVNVNRFNAQVPLQQLRLILQVELNFLRSVCAPTPEQMQRIKQEGLKHIGELKNGQLANNNRAQAFNEFRRSMQEKLAECARAQLSPAQARRYENEIQLRNANLRQACAWNLVVRLDEELSLTEWQRQKLCTELTDNWDDSWTMTAVMASTNSVGFIPSIPDELVVPYLDASQRTLWNSVQKMGNNIVWGGAAGAFLGMGAPTPDDQD
jgi:hypothetical protein